MAVFRRPLLCTVNFLSGPFQGSGNIFGLHSTETRSGFLSYSGKSCRLCIWIFSPPPTCPCLLLLCGLSKPHEVWLLQFLVLCGLLKGQSRAGQRKARQAGQGLVGLYALLWHAFMTLGIRSPSSQLKICNAGLGLPEDVHSGESWSCTHWMQEADEGCCAWCSSYPPE